MLRRLLADRGGAEGGQASPTAAPPGEGSYPVAPDPGIRRLGWLVAAVAVLIVVGSLAALSQLPGLWGSDRPASEAGSAATWLGDSPSTGDAASAPAGGAPTGSVAAPPPAGGPGDPAAGPAIPGGPTAGVTGGAAVPGPAATTAPGATLAPGGTAGSGITAPATGDPPATTAEPAPTITIAPDVKAALADLSAEITYQVDAGQLDPVAGDDLRSKVKQVAREVSAGNWAAARYYADRIREKLRKYRDDGTVTSTGYQALIARVDVLDAALS